MNNNRELRELGFMIFMIGVSVLMFFGCGAFAVWLFS
jgi:hypothetical protein